MSWEEDFLMRRVRGLVDVLKGGGVLAECAGYDSCGSVFSPELERCPNCGKLVDENRPSAAEDTADDETDGPAGTPPNYDKWTVDRLRTDLDERDPAVLYPPAATKKDLARLAREDDERRRAEFVPNA